MVSESTVHQPVSLNIERKRRKYTLQEFLRKEAKSTDKHEFIDGEIIKMPYAKGPHNIITGNMIFQFNKIFEDSEKNYIVFPSDQMVYMPALDVGVYADALAVSERPIYWDDEELLLINPVIIVEVLSKSTQKYDRQGKFDKYKTLESFREYVLVRQNVCEVEVRYRPEKGVWYEKVYQDMEEDVVLQSVGIKIPMKKIYKNIVFKTAK
jgi:Uma2 family endonuclease